jgi:hypothetical protein
MTDSLGLDSGPKPGTRRPFLICCATSAQIWFRASRFLTRVLSHKTGVSFVVQRVEVRSCLGINQSCNIYKAALIDWATSRIRIVNISGQKWVSILEKNQHEEIFSFEVTYINARKISSVVEKRFCRDNWIYKFREKLEKLSSDLL